MRPEEPQLQLLGLLLGDLLRDEPPETRIHAICVLAGPVRDPLHDLARPLHPLGRERRKLGGGAFEQLCGFD